MELETSMGHHSSELEDQHLGEAPACGSEEPEELETADDHKSRELEDHALEHLLDFRLAANSVKFKLWTQTHTISFRVQTGSVIDT